MQAWEYLIVELTGQKPASTLNDLGEHGWELVTVTNAGKAYLKRPVPPEQQETKPAPGTTSRRRK